MDEQFVAQIEEWLDALQDSPYPPDVMRRFWRKIEPDGLNGCWEWVGGKFNTGYGAFAVNRQNMCAHRFAYEVLVGPIPEGKQIDHLCRNRGCVNPRHLQPVTSRENLMRGSTLAAENAAKTICKYGHPFSPENTGRDGLGKRYCRICATERMRRWRAAKRAA